MLDGTPLPPTPRNEPILDYAPGSAERERLKASLSAQSNQTIELCSVVDGKELRTGKLFEVRPPHARSVLLAQGHELEQAQVGASIDAALAAGPPWAELRFEHRAAVFLKAAELLSTEHRAELNAATMLGQSKTAYQAEIDSACELIDFLRFNVEFARRIYEDQPQSSKGTWNITDHRPLEGFVAAVTPFNFTAIAGNLPTAPALMGNTVVWKPAATAAYSAHFVMKLLQRAGLPDGVINLVYADPEMFAKNVLPHPRLAGVHFTGSTEVFRSISRTVGENLARYRTYPRMVAETGGKDFVFAHPSAHVDSLAVALVRGAFEYQGQKCSAASRAYIPASLWSSLKTRLLELVGSILVGDVGDFRNFMGAVIDQRAFERILDRVERAKADTSCSVLSGMAGLRAAERPGFFIRPVLIQTTDPFHPLMQDEIFGPVLTLLVYPDNELDQALDWCDRASPYALTGAFFATDRRAIVHALARLRFAAGNFYINDKPTGAVVGQQPFGGGRASGTNDKAGSVLNLHRWVSPRCIKENFAPPSELAYPFMGAE